jgi:hypothetical protein
VLTGCDAPPRRPRTCPRDLATLERAVEDQVHVTFDTLLLSDSAEFSAGAPGVAKQMGPDQPFQARPGSVTLDQRRIEGVESPGRPSTPLPRRPAAENMPDRM